MKRCTPLLVPILIGSYVAAGPVRSQGIEPSPFETRGAYVGGDIGGSGFHNACEPQALGCDRHGAAWSAFAGYRFGRRLGIELGYLDLGHAHATYPRLTGTLKVTGDIEGWQLSAQYGMPAGQDARFYLQAGGLKWRARTYSAEFTTRDDGWSATLGGGFEWRVAPSWLLRAQYLYLNDLGGTATGGANAHVASLGISYFIPSR